MWLELPPKLTTQNKVSVTCVVQGAIGFQKAGTVESYELSGQVVYSP